VRNSREGGSTGRQMRKLTAGKPHDAPPQSG
jgi:hypothetical protein